MVRAAEAVRDGDADAMVGAGNTGATMAAALLRYGRIRGAARPAIGVPIPVPFAAPHLLVDGGATVDCTPEWLVQFAHMGRAYARLRLGVDEPTVGLLSNGEEPGKGDELRKQTFALLDGDPWFVGNVEGRDLMSGPPARDRHRRLHRQRRARRPSRARSRPRPGSCSPRSARRRRPRRPPTVVAPMLLQGVTDYLDPDTDRRRARCSASTACA